MYDFIFTKTFWLIMKPPAHSFEYKKWGAYVRPNLRFSTRKNCNVSIQDKKLTKVVGARSILFCQNILANWGRSYPQMSALLIICSGGE